MLRVLAVDDEPPALEETAFLLQADPRVAEVATAVDAARALRSVSDAVEAGAPFDALFLDVRMPGPSGIDLARFVAALADPPSVVFVTAHDDFAVTAFDLRAVDYLLKPLREERLAETIGRLAALHGGTAEPRRVAVELGGRTQLIDIRDIYYAEAQGDYVRLRTADTRHLVRASLGALETQWSGAGFVRIHRSVLVASRHVSELLVEGARMRVRVGGELLMVSRRQHREVRDQLVRGGWREENP
ncbi:LytTR family two component transcriptional regulator [Murinocardiopsis flavida]|uniref:LytTR family two component transcriptional regulator n=1 Tax=Murinocardiopsis flavida TaxID=645275 RepID=A0A2P8DI36_9ACTN|nr:LytTR family DNA-binding domain-containing protein [Murinocardiopsis flavida]PSK96894.1 LytTR family two component transcriptional regulator [Murinocardiopsis flavida]